MCLSIPSIRPSGPLQRSQPLCLAKRSVDVIPRARISDQMKLLVPVDDARDPFDPVGSQSLAQRLMIEYHPPRSFDSIIIAFGARGIDNSLPCRASSALLSVMTCFRFLIASSATCERGLVASAQLDDNFDVGVAKNIIEVCGHRTFATRRLRRLADIAHNDRGNSIPRRHAARSRPECAAGL